MAAKGDYDAAIIESRTRSAQRFSEESCLGSLGTKRVVRALCAKNKNARSMTPSFPLPGCVPPRISNAVCRCDQVLSEHWAGFLCRLLLGAWCFGRLQSSWLESHPSPRERCSCAMLKSLLEDPKLAMIFARNNYSNTSCRR